MKTNRWLLVMLLGVFCAPLFAQEQTPVVNRRERRQKQRIQQGVKSGELTRKETRELRQGQKKVRQTEKQAKSDGVVTKDERTEIRKEQNAQSKKIYKAKHDSDKRQKAR